MLDIRFGHRIISRKGPLTIVDGKWLLVNRLAQMYQRQRIDRDLQEREKTTERIPEWTQPNVILPPPAHTNKISVHENHRAYDECRKKGGSPIATSACSLDRWRRREGKRELLLVVIDQHWPPINCWWAPWLIDQFCSSLTKHCYHWWAWSTNSQPFSSPIATIKKPAELVNHCWPMVDDWFPGTGTPLLVSGHHGF